MKCSYHPGYQAPLSPGHPFPMSKYPLLRERLLAEGLVRHEDLVEPEPMDVAAMRLVHTPDYLDKLSGEGLSAAEQRRLGLPWSAALWQRSRLAAGGTLLRADWTRRDDRITRELARFERNGVPMYLLYRHAGAPELLPEVLTQDTVLAALSNP